MDHYGQESIDYLAEPLLAGVYGGDPREMSVNSVLARFVEIEAKYGSLTRGVLAAPRPNGSGSGSLFRTLKNGLGQLVDKLTGSADVVHGVVETLERDGSGFRVRVDGDWMEADHVVLATPAGDAAPLVAAVEREIWLSFLQAVPYTSSITLSLGYRKDTFDHPLNGLWISGAQARAQV